MSAGSVPAKLEPIIRSGRQFCVGDVETLTGMKRPTARAFCASLVRLGIIRQVTVLRLSPTAKEPIYTGTGEAVEKAPPVVPPQIAHLIRKRREFIASDLATLTGKSEREAKDVCAELYRRRIVKVVSSVDDGQSVYRATEKGAEELA